MKTSVVRTDIVYCKMAKVKLMSQNHSLMGGIGL